MEADDLLRHARDVCEAIGADYFVVGSIATIAYGEPRFTNDLDYITDWAAKLNVSSVWEIIRDQENA